MVTALLFAVALGVNLPLAQIPWAGHDWTPLGGQWFVESGEMVVSVVDPPEPPPGVVWVYRCVLTESPDDYDVSVEVRRFSGTEDAQVGLYWRWVSATNSDYYCLNLRPEQFQIYGRRFDSGWIAYSLVGASFRVGDWNRIRVSALGRRHRIFLNDVSLGLLVEPVRTKGTVALKACDSITFSVHFRNFVLTPRQVVTAARSWSFYR